MGVFDKIADEAAKAQPTQMPDRKMAQLEAAPAPVLAPEKINERISRPAAPQGPPKAYAGEGPTDRAATVAHVATDALAAREPMNQHMVDERGMPTEAPVAAPEPQLPVAPTPTEPMDLVGKNGPPNLDAATDAELAGVPPEVAQQPGVRDKLKKLGEIAKAIGVPLLHLIQAGAYGYGGIDKPTVLQTLQAQQADRSKTQEGQAFALKAAQLDRDFAAKMAEIDKQYQATRDTRSYQEAKAAAEQEHANRIEQIRETGRQAKGAGANPELTAKFASQFIPKG